MQRNYLVLWLGVLILLLSACGGGDGGEATAVPSNTPDHTPIELIPTWTPEPTSTQPPPRPTSDITYARPTSTPFMGIVSSPPPTTPTVAGAANPSAGAGQPPASSPNTPGPDQPPAINSSAPNAAPTQGQSSSALPTGPNPTLTITESDLNLAIARELSAALGDTLAQAPTVRFANGQIIIDAVVYTAAGGAQAEAPVSVRVNVLQVQGQPVLTVASATYTQDNAPYDGPLTGEHLDTIEDALATLVDDTYNAARPDDNGYYIAAITINEGTLTLQTVSLTG